ncbi:outer membrane protein assembly factor BamB family protein [Streptomyces nodosus]|uniref:outer membrane protein assembly factor BamB family protein n=1 Tax=Streptomyces nodosus TaxID=40318 RepID=UPI0037F4C1F1
MSQPPPPPNQPPSGGFGAPQDPPPGGFGAPQSPPPGGFGAPQSPPPGGFGAAPTPPPPPQGPSPTPPPPGQGPGYAYPHPGTPPQQPYGYPQQPGYGYPDQQPGYGHPNQPGFAHAPTVPVQPKASGGRRLTSAQLWIVGSALLAIALIIGTGVWYANSSASDGDPHPHPAAGTGDKGGDTGQGGTGGSDGKAREKVPADPGAKVLFQIPAPEIKDKNQIDSVVGSWLTDSVYAKASVGRIVGYDPDTGTTKWTLPLNGQTCGGSRQVSSSGIAAVVSEAGRRADPRDRKPCSEITAFEVATGKKLWTGSVKTGDTPVTFREVSISGNTVAAGGSYDGGAAFDLTTGKVLWQPKVGSCMDVGYAGGEQLVAVRRCGSYGDWAYEVQLLDSKTGSVKWSYKLPHGIDNAKVISTEPVVFGVDSGDITASGVTDVFSLDDTGKLRTKITLADGKYDHDCGVGKVDDCHAITVGNDQLYVPNRSHESAGSISMTNEIVAFSLDTGKTTGKIDGGDGSEIFPLRMDGGNVLVYKRGSYDEGSQVLSADGKSLKTTKLLETPASNEVSNAISSMVPKTSELLYTDGRLFFGKDLVSKPFRDDEKEYIALGFGAK